MQLCYTFQHVNKPDSPITHAVMRYVAIEKEGNREDLFDIPQREEEHVGFKEPKIKWKKARPKVFFMI